MPHTTCQETENQISLNLNQSSFICSVSYQFSLEKEEHYSIFAKKNHPILSVFSEYYVIFQ